ncbi:hypothetical protein [Rhizobium leguminosarum]|uniref:hypothetical protein n=1 Tax=Rhizobium leguminosarum TaxID=384 RepID=UPI001F3D1053|nr:hypothetical protein [Rhizobium leguminosarum]UIJ82425.1 hypothetical protein LZK78_24825 [Rhizobium leguminosarum]
MKRLLASTFLAFLFVGAVSPADAFEINAKATARLEAEVGLDAKTIAFLNRFPSEVRVQIVQTLKESLPLIDKSVEGYITQVNGVISSSIDQAACRSTVPIGVLFDEVKDLVLPGEYKSKPVETLTNDFAEIASDFSAKSTPHDYRMVYSDFLHRAAITGCQAGLSPETVAEISVLQQMARPKWNLWLRLDGVCTNADACLTWLRKDLDETIAKADPRDVAVVNGSSRLTALKSPTQPGFFDRLRGVFYPGPYEDVLLELYSIGDGTRVAEKVRHASAEADLADGIALIDEAEKTAATARSQLSGQSSDANNLAIQTAGAVSKDRARLAAIVANAAETWSAIGDRFTLQMARYNAAVENAKATSAEAAKLNAEIAARQERIRDRMLQRMYDRAPK